MSDDDASSLAYHRSRASSTNSLSEISVHEIDPNYVPGWQPGERPHTQELYRAGDRLPWSESSPDDTKTAKDVEASSFAQQCALIVRREPHPITKKTALHSITVQSRRIRHALEETYADYEGLNMQLKELTFKAPFHPFYYRWHRFEKLCKREQDEETHDHLNLLYMLMKEEINPHIEMMSDLTKNNAMTFDYLWTLFSPGMEVYTTFDGQDRFMEVIDSRYGANMGGEFFTLECRYIDCDGLNFGYVASSIDINKFDGVKKLVDLDAFPSHLHPNIENLMHRLHIRGSKFERLNGFHHVAYSGFYTARSSRQIRKRHVDNSRIIIDAQTFNIHGPPGPALDVIDPESLLTADGDSIDTDSLADSRGVVYNATSKAYSRYQVALQELKKQRQTDRRDESNMSSRQLLLCAPTVRGYCLAFKTWAEFYVENIIPIQWSKDAFPRLVLPHGYKDIIRAFVQEQLAREDEFDDIVYGKGLGFIMLLSGEPGVGKTLTAESVAEEMQQPLYMLSASELGETATEVEESLQQVLELTSAWNAILLLDECDMFLEARSTADIRRNRLVSVFLRQLEYYRGVMFLTSNRIRDFDPAFESRIHLTIHYPALDTASRLHVWTTFVQMGHRSDAAGSQLSERDLETLAAIEFNGREIKNIVKTARLLCKQEKVPLAMKHVQLVLEVKKRGA